MAVNRLSVSLIRWLLIYLVLARSGGFETSYCYPDPVDVHRVSVSLIRRLLTRLVLARTKCSRLCVSFLMGSCRRFLAPANYLATAR